MTELAEVSGKSIDEIKADVKKLAEEFQKTGDNIPLSYKKAYDKIGVYSEKAEKKIKQSSEETKEEVKDDADEMGKSHKKNSEKASNSWEKTFSVLGNIGVAGLKVLGIATTAAATGLSVLGTAAVNTFADYEQLVGGVETLFGASGKSLKEYADSVGKSQNEVYQEYVSLIEAENEVLHNASIAYETAGLSANAYMETVTGIAAALKQSTGSELEAAKAADQAIIDMSDNANKMGTSMESIQNAYQGFAKQNYTMLDNLKLGYGGTKEEMERLLEDATALSGVEYDLDSLSDVYEAIHVIQTELGITGTTAKEASTTISGSANAMKASWQNLLVGIADDSQNFDSLIDNFVESTATFADNILPRVGMVLEGIEYLIDEIAPIIIEKVPEIVFEVAPEFLQAGMQMVFSMIEGISENIPQIIDIVHEMVDMFLEELEELIPGISSVTDVIQLLIDNFDSVLAVIVPLTAAFVAWKTAVSIAGIIEAFSKAMNGMTLAQKAAQIAQDLLNKSMLANPIVLITTLLAGLVAAFIYLWNTNEEFRQFWINLWDSIKAAAENVCTVIAKIFTENIPAAINDVIKCFSELPDRIAEFLSRIIADVIIWASDMLINAQKAATDFITTTANIIAALPGKIAVFLSTILANVIAWAADMLAKGQKAGNDFVSKVVEYISQLPGKIQGFINQIISTVTTFVTNMGNKAVEAGKGFYDKIVEALSGLPEKMTEIGSNIVSGIWNGISSGWSWLTSTISELANNLFETAKQELGINSPSRKFKWIAEMCVAGWDEGFEPLMDPNMMTRNVKAGLASMQAGISVQSHGRAGESNTIYQTINVNREIATADQLARAMRIESRYGMMRGAPIGQGS